MKTTTSITFEDFILEKIDKIASKEGRTRSNMVHRILENWFCVKELEVEDEDL